MKHHYIYIITCVVTNKFYIGIHSTNNLKDGYMGGGTYIKRSIKKYGKETHKLEILEFFPNRKSLVRREEEIVNEEMIKDNMCMNLVPGGENKGWYITIGMVTSIDKDGKIHWINKDDPRYLSGELVVLWLGRKHKEESKKKIGKKNSLHQKGEGNSQHDTHWIYHPEEKRNMKIKKEELDVWTQQGWIKGRKIKIL